MTADQATTPSSTTPDATGHEPPAAGTETRTVRTDDAALNVQVIGDPTAPAIVLLAGAAGSMDWWEDEFCERLAAGGPAVIRYDSRDTGQSTTWPAGAPGYDGSDLASDVVAVLDDVEVSRCHLVGMSQGGGVALRVALDHPDRVASLTLVSTTPGGDDLPGPEARIESLFSDPDPEPDWADRQAAIDGVVEGERPFAGSAGFDEVRMRGLATRVVDRTTDMAASMANHFVLEEGAPLRERLGELAAPTLVVHGTDDPLFPIRHGEVLADEIPDASLLRLAGIGHEYPPPETWDVVLPAILDLVARVDRTARRP